MDLTGKVALVTGAASGIGLAAAEEMRRRGALVVTQDRREPADYCFDLRDDARIRTMLREIEDRYGALDAVVHSAGIQTYGTAGDTSDELWDETIDVNVKTAFRVCRAALPGLERRGGGAIILVGSVQSVGAVSNSAAYVTSKHALLGLARSIALDYGPKNIRALCVCPGAIDTPMLRRSADMSGDPDGVLDSCARIHVFRRLGSAAEVGRVIAFLASDDASFMTGSAVMVDGGCMVPIGGADFVESGTGTAKI